MNKLTFIYSCVRSTIAQMSQNHLKDGSANYMSLSAPLLEEKQSPRSGSLGDWLQA